MTFSERLTELRKSKGWSQEQLGERLSVTRQTVSKWELGSTTPEMEKLAAMSELFGISIDALVKGGETAPTQELSDEKPQRSRSNKAHFEYKSARMVRGVPLVHVNIGLGKYKARGIFAIGNAAVGVFALGLAAAGVVSVGLVTIGVLSLAAFAAIGILACGGAACGVFAAGGAAVGVFAAGGAAVGWLACGGAAAGKYAFGGYASATDIAFGGFARGIIAIGENVEGKCVITEAVSQEEFRAAAANYLPDTPKFIVDIFAQLAEKLQ